MRLGTVEATYGGLVAIGLQERRPWPVGVACGDPERLGEAPIIYEYSTNLLVMCRDSKGTGKGTEKR